MTIKFSCITSMPNIISAALGVDARTGVVARAINEGLVGLEFINFRDHALNERRDIDDRAVAGSDGMVLLPEVCQRALHACRNETSWVVALSPSGKVFNRVTAQRLSQKSHVVLVCGRYAGFDARFVQQHVDEEISVGDFILSGGELPAACLIDAVARLIPGVLGNVTSAKSDSFEDGLLEPPQYTRPRIWEGLPTPEELLSGDHQKISLYQRKQQIVVTAKQRPDLILLAWDKLSRAERALAERVWKKGY